MNATRDKLATLHTASLKVIERMPLLHRLAATAMLQTFVSIVEDLLGEVEQLREHGQGPGH